MLDKLQFISNIIAAPNIKKGPVRVSLDLTDKCNLKCVFCNPKTNAELDSTLINGVIQDLRTLKVKEVMLTGGGEPLLYPNLFEIIRELKDSSMRVGLTTNGTLLRKLAIKNLLKLKLDSLIVSLSAHDEYSYLGTHRGVKKDTFKGVIQALQNIIKIRQNMKINYPQISICHVITKKNYKSIMNMINLGKNLGINTIYLQPVFVYIENHKKLFLSKTEIISVLNKLQKNKNNNHFLDGMYVKRMNSIFATFGIYHNNLINEVPCYISVYSAKIRSTGEVLPCCCRKDKKMIMGNLHQNTFKNIWFSAKYQQFRNKSFTLAKGKYPLEDYCRHYCHYFYYNLKTLRRVNPLKYRKIAKKINSLKLINI